MDRWMWLCLGFAAVLFLGAVVHGMWTVRLDRSATADMDAELTDAGHAPPETDPEKTGMIPVVRPDEDMAHGTHSAGTESIRVGQIRVVRRSDGSIFFQRLNIGEPVGFEASHHPQIGCVLASALVAREGMLA